MRSGRAEVIVPVKIGYGLAWSAAGHPGNAVLAFDADHGRHQAPPAWARRRPASGGGPRTERDARGAFLLHRVLRTRLTQRCATFV